MPFPREPQDPFTSRGPLTSNTSTLAPASSSLRSQTSQQSLRSNTSTASTRLRQGRELFAPSRSRRPASRATPHLEDGVLADSDSENATAQQHQQRQLRRARQGSPERNLGRAKAKPQDEPEEFVNRQPDGGFLWGLVQWGEIMAVPQVMTPRTEEEQDQDEVDAHYVSIARQYFTSGASLGGRGSKKHEEELEQLRLPMMMRLREQVMQQLEDDRWLYEPVDRFSSGGL